jgi:hypothetical protein
MAQVHIHVVGVRAQCGCGLDGGAAQCAKNALPNFGNLSRWPALPDRISSAGHCQNETCFFHGLTDW